MEQANGHRAPDGGPDAAASAWHSAPPQTVLRRASITAHHPQQSGQQDHQHQDGAQQLGASAARNEHHLSFPELVRMVTANRQKESFSEAHKTLRSYPGNDPARRHVASLTAAPEGVPGLDTPAATGVIYVMDRASKLGYSYGNKSWANFGQGAPEVGKIPDAPPRPTIHDFPEETMEYAPVAGLQELRQAVANLYNERYRKGKQSKYTWENVAITPGGRSGMTRVASVIGDVNVGYFLPEYTAYESMLGIFKRFLPIPTVTHAKYGYQS